MDAKQGAEIASRYTRFAADEAYGRSPLYEMLARAVAGDASVIEFLTTLPSERRQPNLLLAAVRHLFGTLPDWTTFREAILAHADAVRAVMLTHTTQTNEPARCAILLPVLASLPQPLALIEVGASAGLCLLPDLYGYDYGRTSIHPDMPAAECPVFPCSANEITPLPGAMPRVVWRAGLDLNPLDVSEPSQAAWLENLVWPEQTERLQRLRAAMRIAAAARPRVMRGNLLGDGLATLCGEAPKDATLVIFHTAVLAYIVSRVDRAAFAARAMSLCRFWIANETPRVFPDIAHHAGAARRSGDFLMSVNGSPVAWTDPHGGAIEWIAERSFQTEV